MDVLIIANEILDTRQKQGKPGIIGKLDLRHMIMLIGSSYLIF